MPTLTINGKQVTVPAGTPIIRAAAQVGVNIPHFCYHPTLSTPGNCRMCLVESSDARGLAASCYHKCTEGAVVNTETARVKAARQAVLEFILVNHPVDCPICDQAGECKLQDYYMTHDHKPSRVSTTKNSKSKAKPIGPHVVFDGERCILCTRCIRFCDEITGTSELTTEQRGDHTEITTFPGRELDNAYSMCVTDLCPVGALTTRDFRFKTRVWLLSSTDSLCTGCSRGCNIHMEHHQGEVKRYRPRLNPEVNEYWMCDEGRLSYQHHNLGRTTAIRLRDQREVQWPRAARQTAEALTAAVATANGQVAMLTSPQLSCESLLAAREFAASVLGNATVYVGGNPSGGNDAFLITSDKNPNRAGVVQVFGPAILANTAYKLLEEMEQGRVQVLYLMRGELPFDTAGRARFAAALSRVALVVYQGPHGLDLEERAHIFLPSATHAEQDGTFVNETGYAQAAYAAVPAMGQALADWDVLSRIARAADRPLSFDSFDALHATLAATIAAE